MHFRKSIFGQEENFELNSQLSNAPHGTDKPRLTQADVMNINERRHWPRQQISHFVILSLSLSVWCIYLSICPSVWLYVSSVYVWSGR